MIDPNVTTEEGKEFDLLAFSTTNEILDPDFEFSDHPHAFENEFYSLTGLLVHQQVIALLGNQTEEKKYAGVDLAVMKAMLHAGQMIERLKHEGKIGSDIPTKGGRTSWKVKVDKQDVIDEYTRMGKSGKLPEAMAREIQDVLLERGVTEDQLYSTKHIRRILDL